MEAESMVDVALQRSTCAGGPGHQWLHTCIQGQGWECSCRDWYIHGLSWITVQSGGKQERAHTNSNGEDSYLMWEIRRDKEVDMTDIWSTAWRAWMTYYKVEEMIWEAIGGAQVSPLLRGFSPAPLCVVVFFCWFFVCFLFLFACFWLPAGEKTPASNSSFTLFAFAYFESWPTMPRARSAMQEKKNESKKKQLGSFRSIEKIPAST